MKRPWLRGPGCVLVGCGLAITGSALAGCGGGPAPEDAGSDGGAAPCAVVDGRGGAGRFASIDDALGAGASRVCLAEGDFTPPHAAIERAVTIEGMGAATRLDGSFACAEVAVPTDLETPTRRAASAVVAIHGADVTLRTLTLRRCDLGVLVEGGTLVTDDVVIEAVDLGVLGLGAGTRVSLDTTHVTARALHVDSRVTFTGGVGVAEGASLSMTGSSVEDGAGAIGIVAFDAPSIVIEQSSVTGGVGGFFLRPAVGASARVSHVTVEALREIDVAGTVGVGANVVSGEAASVEDLTVRDVQGYALVARDGAALGVARLTAEDIRDLAVAARADGTIHLTGGSLTRVGAGLGADTGGRTFVSGEVAIEASSAALVAFSGGAVEVEAGSALLARGGGFGGFSDDGGTLSVLGGTIEGAQFGLVSNGGQVVARSVTIRDVSVGLGAWGPVTASDTSLERASVAGATTTGTAPISLERVSFEASGPVWLGGGAHTLTDVTIHAALDAGVLIDEAGSVEVLRGMLADGQGRGVEVRSGAHVSIDGTTIRNNVGAGIALYDGSANVHAVTFGGTRLDATGRADEIRLVAGEGTTREIVVEANTFLLDVPRTCPPGACTLLLGDGGDAQGIVRPNCLVATPGSDDVRTVVDQNGATLTLEGDAGWSTLLGGPGSGLGLDVGTVGARPTLPALPMVGALPSTF
ncbi:MAG: right-handed parallel beta-helix repeat-containing protein [Sandaracinaceae bacterium]|nr:right-handed parallel beta-helix repeat-containing protein [Sandaracinaceae bacterium]